MMGPSPNAPAAAAANVAAPPPVHDGRGQGRRRRLASKPKRVDVPVAAGTAEAPTASSTPPPVPPQTSGPSTPLPTSKGAASAGCMVIWCDHHAFKDDSVLLRDRLDSATGLSTKAHKTAEKCIRLLRKKRNAKARPLSVFLVSFANAPPLVRYLSTADHVYAKVVVLCDSARCRSASARLAAITSDAAGGRGENSSLVEAVVGSFAEAVDAVAKLTAAAIAAAKEQGWEVACKAEDESDLEKDDGESS